MAALLSSPIASAGSSSRHRALADEAETLGHLADAAREYEAAWQEERAPELLYRLGIVRRKLREYAKAKEAFRGYLRAAPDGALRDEVERQLVKLAVLAEAQQEEAAPQRRRANATPKPAAKVPAGSEAAKAAPTVAPPEPATRPPEPVEPPAREPEAAAPSAGVEAPRAPLEAPRAGVEAPHAPLEVPRAAPRAAPRASIEAPRPALVAPRAQDLPARSARAAPWLAAGAAVAAGAGAAFWWDGSRVSRELDARFAAGELAAADAPRYARARNEAIAGRVLVAAALALAGTALVLW